MTAYITYADFATMYGDQGIAEEQFPVYATSADALIDTLTRYAIPRCGGLSALPLWVQRAVQRAAAAQVLYYVQNGLETVLTGQTGQGFSVGKVRIDGGASRTGDAGGNEAAQMMVSPMAAALLEQTGLMGRDVGCYDPSRNSFCGIW